LCIYKILIIKMIAELAYEEHSTHQASKQLLLRVRVT
jgi:hypothetical protein